VPGIWYSIRNVQRCNILVACLSLSVSVCLSSRMSCVMSVMQFSCLVVLAHPFSPTPCSCSSFSFSLNAFSLLFVFNKFCVLSCCRYLLSYLCVCICVLCLCRAVRQQYLFAVARPNVLPLLPAPLPLPPTTRFEFKSWQ